MQYDYILTTVWCLYNAVKYNNTAYILAVTQVKYKSKLGHTKYIPYLTLTGKLYSAFCKNFGENWQGYNSTMLYHNEAWTRWATFCRQNFEMYFKE